MLSMSSKGDLNVAIISGIIKEKGFQKKSKIFSSIFSNNVHIPIFWNKSAKQRYYQMLGKRVLVYGKFVYFNMYSEKQEKYYRTVGIKVLDMEVVNDF